MEETLEFIRRNDRDIILKTQLEVNLTKERTIGRNLFVIILITNALGCYIMGGTIIADTALAFESGFGITYTSDLEMLGLVIGLELFFLGSMALIGILLTRKGKMAGVLVGSSVGAYMFIFGIAAFIKMGTTDALIVDSIRGFITLIFGYMAYKELKKVNG